MKMTETIYVYILDEGTDVWRPVEAEKVTGSVFRIPSTTQVPDDEKWMFKPGDIVLCELKNLADGIRLVATRKQKE